MFYLIELYSTMLNLLSHRQRAVGFNILHKSTKLLISRHNNFLIFLRENVSIIQRQDTKQRMSRIVTHQGTVYLCGQVCADATQNIEHQTQTMLDKVDQLLLDAGSDRHHILSATIYIKDMQDFAAMNTVWDKWVPEGHAPARACVQASMARPELLVEISVIAAKK